MLAEKRFGLLEHGREGSHLQLKLVSEFLEGEFRREIGLGCFSLMGLGVVAKNFPHPPSRADKMIL